MFYGADQARIHDRAFGDLAATAALDVLDLLGAGRHERGLVVDLGCGSGILASRVIDAGYDVLGVDISADMVALARDRAPAAEFRVGSLHDLAIPAGCVADLLTILVDTGYEVDVLDKYASQGAPPALPGWCVVRARKS